MGVSPLATLMPRIPLPDTHGPLVAYVGTFSSPLRDTLPTQVDLPPGNGRGIHVFRADRSTGRLTPAGIVELGYEPELSGGQCQRDAALFGERDRSRRRGQTRHGQRVFNRSCRWVAGVAEHRALRRCRTDLRQHPSRSDVISSWRTTSAAPWQCCRFCRTAGWASERRQRRCRHHRSEEGRRTRRRAASPSAGTIAPTPT